jgi:hypothetical protein
MDVKFSAEQYLFVSRTERLYSSIRLDSEFHSIALLFDS